MNKPQVTICVPVYNVEKYIERCVRSICNQTLSDIEIIFINDCSSDKSWEILRSIIHQYPKRQHQIHLLENQKNSGPGISRQRCAQKATGEFIYFADADDWLEPDMLEKMYNTAMEKNADIVGCQVRIISREGIPFESNYRTSFDKREWIKNMILMPDLSISIALWTRLIKRSLYEKTIVNDNEVEGLVRYEDFLNVVKCHYYAKKVVWLADPLYNHDWSNFGSVTKTEDDRAIESGIRVANALQTFFRTQNDNNYSKEIDHFKVGAKNKLINNTKHFNPARWRSLWPDLNHIEGVPRKVQFGMFLASKKLDQVLFMLNWLKESFEKIRK